MTREAWRRVALGYVILSLAWLFGAGWTYVQERHVRHLTHKVQAETTALALAAQDFCEALRHPDAQENIVLDRFNEGLPVEISPQCRQIVTLLLKRK